MGTFRRRPACLSLLFGFILFVFLNEKNWQKSSRVSAFCVERSWATRSTSTTHPTLGSEAILRHPTTVCRLSSSESDDSDPETVPEKLEEGETNGVVPEEKRRRRIQRLANLARNVVIKPISYAAPLPQAIAAILRDSTLGALDMAVEEVANRRIREERNSNLCDGPVAIPGSDDLSSEDVDITRLVNEAFSPLEKALEDMEDSLRKARKSMAEAKALAADALGAVQVAALAQAAGAVTAVAAAEQKVIDDIFASTSSVDISSLTFDDVDFDTSEMAPPFLNEDLCLIPGEPVVRVEKAPENSRRIFAGIDIMASKEDVWKVLTDYANLQNVIPNLVVNEVLDIYGNPAKGPVSVDTSKPENIQCRDISRRMKGALLRQVGGAKVAGINFSARTTLEVREWPTGMPDFAHFKDEVWEGKSRQQRANEYSKVKLQRYCFPRPFAISSLPTRDISMQSIENDDGEFRMYQGVWRMQPLPGCAPKGQEAMRLTYAVEVSPRAYLPVQLIEGRIVRDLCTNLQAIRDFVTEAVPETSL